MYKKFIMMKINILKHVEKRNDDWVNADAAQKNSVNDLVAAEVVYHKKCCTTIKCCISTINFNIFLET